VPPLLAQKNRKPKGRIRRKIMTINEILSKCDHTLLAQGATFEEIRAVCDDGIKYGTASVCIPASHVKKAKEYVGDKLAICTVIGFPNGYSTTATKVFECRDAIENGADEVDIVMNVGKVLEGNYDEAANEVEVLREESEGATLKVILETGALHSPELIYNASLLAMAAGADFVKTSTGKITEGATPEAAVVMCLAIAEYHRKTGRRIGFKAAGGVRTAADAALYYTIVKELLSEEWLTPELFRIGASSLANELLSAIEGKEIKYF
jgi:deoxyribose-phosphate aldolase